MRRLGLEQVGYTKKVATVHIACPVIKTEQGEGGRGRFRLVCSLLGLPPRLDILPSSFMEVTSTGYLSLS